MPHEVDFLLSCTHLGREPVEAAIFLPTVGEIRTCSTCRTQQKIVRVGRPYWVEEDQPAEPQKKQEKK